MATGDLNDLRSRIKATLPRWFADSSPILDAVLSGAAQALSFVYSLYLYARMQTRIKTATDGWLDLIAGDFFGTRILRRANQSDASFRAIIIANLFRERATRAALIQVLTDLTGRAPVLIEPQQPGDTGAYGGTDAITISGTPQVFRNDWQGNQLLYTTPRTNLLLQSVNLTLTPWFFASGVRTLLPGAGPGGIDATLYQGPSTGPATTNFAATSTSIAVSVYAKAAGGDTVGKKFLLRNGTTATNFVTGLWSPVDGSIVGAGWTSRSVGDGWYQLSYSQTTGIAVGQILTLYPGAIDVTVAGYALLLAAPQAEIGTTVTSWIPTAASAITVTDYTIDGAGNIVFAQAPLSGAVLSWSGTYLNARTSQTVTVSGKTFANGDGFSTAFSVAPKYGYPCGYGVAGFYGSKLLPSQMFLIAYRPASAGIPNIAGYGNPQGAYRTPPVSMYASLSMIQGQVTDADIYAAIDSVKPVGTVIWTTIKS